MNNKFEIQALLSKNAVLAEATRLNLKSIIKNQEIRLTRRLALMRRPIRIWMTRKTRLISIYTQNHMPEIILKNSCSKWLYKAAIVFVI